MSGLTGKVASAASGSGNLYGAHFLKSRTSFEEKCIKAADLIACGQGCRGANRLWFHDAGNLRDAILLTMGANNCVGGTRVRLFGKGPSSPHNVQVVRVDEGHGEIETEESGGLVRVWNNRMHVEPVSEAGCRYTDRIQVQAGLLTPLVWLFAVGFYCYRQRRWQRWVRVAEVSTEGDAPSDTGCDVVSGSS